MKYNNWRSRLQQALHRPSPFLCALFLSYIFVFASLSFMEPRPIVLHVGIFAGSNWDVPDGNSYAYIDEVIQRFEAEHPNVKVVYQSGIRKKDYSEWLAEHALSGDMPDIFLIPQDDFDLYTERNALAPLDDLAKSDSSLQLEEFCTAGLRTQRRCRRTLCPARRVRAASDVCQPHPLRARGHSHAGGRLDLG